MENKQYIKRIVDKQIDEYLQIFGALYIVGPKWCGKSETCLHASKSNISFADFIDKKLLKVKLNDNPNFALDGEKPRLIDEWQDAPSIWDAVRRFVDKSSSYGQFLLTGSSSTKVETSHSGIGRITRVKMYPMSLFETNESNGLVSLKDLFDNKFAPCKSALNLKDIITICCRGGWPELIGRNLTLKQQLLKTKKYFEDIYENDMLKVDNVRRDSNLMKSILNSYARNISTLAKDKTIIDDAKTNANTFNSYISVLKDMYIVEELEPWNLNLRSASSIRKGPKREFTDPSIAVAALGASPNKLYDDLNTFGLIFETLCIRDLRVYSSNFGGRIYYYADKTGLECDAVLVLDDGRYALIEFKLADADSILDGIKNMNAIEKLVIEYNEKNTKTNNGLHNSRKMELPSFKMVLTNMPESLKVDDKTYIISIGTLKD